MKRMLISIVLLVSLISLSSAGSVGISPAKFSEYFEPNFEKNYSFKATSYGSSDFISLSLEGDLSKFANLSKTSIADGESFIVNLKLPFALSKPGPHDLLVTVTENSSEVKVSTVSGIAQIQARISIFVPYPGKYIESTFQVYDVNEGEDAKYDLSINNLGTETVTIEPKIAIYEGGSNEKIRLEETLDKITLETKNSIRVQGYLNTSRFPPGTYNLTATLYHYNITQFNRTFRVGQKALEIKDYNHQFIQGKINPFRILVQSKWNSKMDPVYAKVTITKKGNVVGRFVTVSDALEPWQIKNLTGFFDAENLEIGRYLASIVVHYEDQKVGKLVAIYVNEAQVSRDYKPFIIIALSILGLFLLILLALLIKRVNQLKKRLRKEKNEKRK